MSQGPIERTLGAPPSIARRQNPILLLTFVLTALFAWASSGAVSGGWAASEGPSRQPAWAQADRLLTVGFAHVTPVDAPDQDELETLSEQVEDPLLAFGPHAVAFRAAGEAEPTAHGAVRGWAIRGPIFRSSSARGPPLS